MEKPRRLSRAASAPHDSEATNSKKHDIANDDPFSDDHQEGHTNYRSMTWLQGAFLAIAETVSIGVLSLPSVIAAVGLAPGIVLIAGLGVITTYTGYTLIQFKLAYPGVQSMSEVGYILLGRWGYEVINVLQVIYLLFSGGAHILSLTIAWNAISAQATCTIVWSVVSLVLYIIASLPRTLKSTSYISAAAFVSIFSAVMLAMIDLGVDRKVVASGIVATQATSFISAFSAVSDIIFAYSGHVTFFTIMSELREPHDFVRSLISLQIFATVLYIIVAVVIYLYTGPDVESPALLSLPSIPSRIAFGIAVITILGAGTVIGHVGIKAVYVRIFRGTRHLTSKSFFSYGVWTSIVVGFWLIAWIIAESIPNFNTLLGLISSIFASWFSYGLSGIIWLHLYRRKSKNGRIVGDKGRWLAEEEERTDDRIGGRVGEYKDAAESVGKGAVYGWSGGLDGRGGWLKSVILIGVNWGLIAMAFAIMALGLWTNGVTFNQEGTAGQVWSCGEKS